MDTSFASLAWTDVKELNIKVTSSVHLAEEVSETGIIILSSCHSNNATEPGRLYIMLMDGQTDPYVL